MSLYVPGGGGYTPGPFASPGGGAVKFRDTGSNVGVYKPTAPGAGSGQPGGAPNTEVEPGVISVNPLDPVESAQQAAANTGGLLDGLASALFGPKTGILTGGLTGAIAEGTDPVSGLLRGAGGIPGGIGDTIANAADVVGGALERVPAGINTQNVLEKEYEAASADPAFQKWLDQADEEGKTNRERFTGDKGLFDTGVLGNEASMKSQALREFAKAQNAKDPALMPGAFQTPGSLADNLTNMMDGLGVVGTAWSRTLLGIKGVEDARAIGAGDAVSTGFLGTGLFAGSKEATPSEQLVAKKLADGSWTKDQAMDFLVAAGNTAHDAGLSIAIMVASPDIAAGFGAAALAKAGVKGAQVAAGVDKAADLLSGARTALSAAEDAVKAARYTKTGAARAAFARGEVTRDMKAADKALEAAKATVAEREAAVTALQGYRTGDDIRKVNVVDRLAQGREAPQKLVTAFGRTYTGLEGTYIGRMAKLTRYLIDPMHGIDLKRPGTARMVDLYADVLTEQLHTTMNPFEGMKNFAMFREIDPTGALADRYAKALATGMTNRGREVLLTGHQRAAIDKGLAGALQTAESAALREEAITAAAASTKERDLLAMLREDITKNIIRQEEFWNPTTHKELARKLEAVFGLRQAEEWEALLPAMSKEQKSLLDFALYAESNRALLNGISNAKAGGHAAVAKFDLDKMVLLSEKTLTKVGADSLLSKLGKAKSDRKRLAIIAEWQEKYPALNVVTMDPGNTGKFIKRFTAWVEDNMESFPMQLKKDELKKMPDELQELSANLGNGYQLGFRPKDEFLWGIERSNEKGGGFVARSVPWADHVAEGGRGYRPGIELPKNIAGMPIVGTALTKAAKPIDYLAAGAKMFSQQVTGHQVHEIARARFVSKASTSVYRKSGLTEHVANKWWDRLQEYTREHQGYSGPRGFGKGDLYKAIADEGLIPQTMLNGSMRFTEQDILKFVLEAYDGDIRFIGLTQKLSGRAKLMMSAMTGYETNFAGQIAEHAWPVLKFRYNPIFQTQEKVEPWVLNTLRGISTPFWKPTMTQADRAVERMLARMTDNSLLSQATLDQAEYVQLLNFDRNVKALTVDPTKRMNRIAMAAGSIMDVQGVKRIGALRTFRKGLGKELRGAWDDVSPGTFDDMKSTADGMAGRILDEDEFAVQMLNEQMFANDIVVRRLDKATGRAGTGQLVAEQWENSIKTGEWSRPIHVGELRPLDLDHVAKGMQAFADGQKVANLADLRRVIAASDKPGRRIEEVSDFLRRLGADKDYVARVENSLTFSWTGFWKEAEKRYNLTIDESRTLQNFMADAGSMRGMNPTDFMSQVFNPGIIDGMEGLLGSLDQPLGMLRKNKEGLTVGRGRSRLAAPIGGTATREDLVKQMSAVFSAHLDPSARRALLMEFRPELLKEVKNGKVRLHMDDIKAMWDSDAEDMLADRILGYMDGKYGDDAHDVITDVARGNKAVRDGADKYLREHGVTPLDERRHYKHDDAHYEQVAGEYRGLPEVPYEKTGRRPSTKAVYSADTDLKPQPAGVDDRTYKAYEQFVFETKEQFDFITRPKSQGGMGIKVIVAKGDPYTPDAAGRAAMNKDISKGELRVKGTDSDHPLMTNEQNTMFRAVHDIFGHSADDFSFGPRGELNAAANHFKLYGPDARGPLLTETHGQTAYVNYSDDVIPGSTIPRELDAANPAADFEARHPFEVPKTQQPATPDPDMPAPDSATVKLLGFEHTYSRRLGDGIMNLPPDMQAALLQPIEDLMTEFPELRIFHLDAFDFEGPAGALDDNILTGLGYQKGTSPFALTFGADDGEPVILFNAREADQVNWADDWAKNKTYVNDQSRTWPTFTQDDGKGGKASLPRRSELGVGHNNPDYGTQKMSVQGIMRHEAGHAFDVDRRPQKFKLNGDGSTARDKAGRPIYIQHPLTGYEDYHNMMVRFEKAAGRAQISEYAAFSGTEFAAELFSLATDPSLNLDALAMSQPELFAMVDEFQTYLKSVGEWAPPVVNPNAGKTVREANAAARGSVYAPQKAGILPQETIDDFARRYVGQGKHVESNPDVARVAQQFSAFSQKVMQNGILQGDNAVHAGLLQDIAKMPTGQAAPYNFTEGLAHQLAVTAMQNKWNDAYRLQYFSQSRTMLERSINHPMFGLYPASYMWGKIMPEVIQFIAQRPFGLRTGSVLSGMMDAQAQIALRREFDPEFDAKIEDLGHSQAVSFLGYMLPTIPWDISASFPTWMKSVASQGADNAEAVSLGQPTTDFNVVKPATDVIGKLNPLETTLPWAGRAVEELNGPNTPAEQLRDALSEAQAGQVQAGELGTPLWYVMQELQAELAK